MKKFYTANPTIDERTISELTEVLRSGKIAQGPKVQELEEKFANYCGVKYCAAVNSGTAALHAALFAAGVKEGDEVITTPFSFIATVNSILMLGANPVFVDIDLRTFNIDTQQIKNRITTRTKAILPVHLFGMMTDMVEVMEIAAEKNLIVVEDAAQAHGSTHNDEMAGSIGHLGAFSLYATKNMMSGEGGLVTSNNEEYIEKVKSFRHHGQHINQKYNYLSFGYNFRMTDIQAVIGINQLRLLPAFNSTRIRNANQYDQALRDVPGIETPYTEQSFKHVYHQYTIKIDPSKYGQSREKLTLRLNNNGVYPGVFYPKSLHLVPTISKYGFTIGDYPISEKMCNEVLSLPVHPGIEKEDIIFISDIIKDFAN